MSWVTGVAASSLLIGPTQRFLTPQRGAIQATRAPSGLICPLNLAGFPNRCARGIRLATEEPPRLVLCHQCVGSRRVDRDERKTIGLVKIAAFVAIVETGPPDVEPDRRLARLRDRLSSPKPVQHRKVQGCAISG